MGEQAGECLYKCVIEHHFEGGTVWQKGWPQGGNRVATGWPQAGNRGRPRGQVLATEDTQILAGAGSTRRVESLALLTQIVAITHKVACQSI